MSCQESTRRFLLRFLLGRAATLVSILDLVSKLIVESIGQSTFLSFFEDDVCSVFSASRKFLPESRHKCGNVTHVRFATSIFFDGQKKRIFTSAFSGFSPIAFPNRHLSVTRPWICVSEKLGRRPMLDYAGCVLNNWERIDPEGPLKPSNLRLLRRFTGLVDEESW